MITGEITTANCQTSLDLCSLAGIVSLDLSFSSHLIASPEYLRLLKALCVPA